MKRKGIKLIGAVALIVVLISAALLIPTLFHRYPWDSEVAKHFQQKPSDAVVIDSTQGDIGYFGVKIGDDELFFVETFKQWVFPGNAFDWNQ